MKAMIILKETLCNGPALNTLDFSNGAGKVVVGVDPILEG
jgi:hypothetical protein